STAPRPAHTRPTPRLRRGSRGQLLSLGPNRRCNGLRLADERLPRLYIGDTALHPGNHDFSVPSDRLTILRSRSLAVSRLTEREHDLPGSAGANVAADA